MISVVAGFPITVAEIIVFGLASLGAYLAWTAGDRDARWGDVGRSLLLGALLAFAFGLYDRGVQQREAKEAFRQTISLQRNLRGADFSGDDLSGLQLVGKNLQDADLSEADLSDANLTEANLTGAEMNGADLSGADLTEATLVGASLDAATLDDSGLYGANLRGATFYDASLLRTGLVRANLRDSCFADANLAGARLVGATLYGAQFARADLEGTTFEEDYRPARVGPETPTGSYLPAAGFHQAEHLDERRPPDFELPSPTSFEPNKRTSQISALQQRRVKERRVVEVSDGDTVILTEGAKSGETPAKLIGVDAPPIDQDLGDEAQEWLERLLLDQEAVVKTFDLDDFGRQLAYIWINDKPVNALLARKGYVTVESDLRLHKALKNELLKAEEAARMAARGLWTGCPPS